MTPEESNIIFNRLKRKMDSIIELKNITIGYRDKKKDSHVAKNLSAELKQGQLACLLGANGKGKSTLMKTMCGFLHPFTGEIFLNGKNISQMDERAMASQIAIVLTDRLIVPNATVFELVSYGRSPFTGFLGKLKKTDLDAVHRALELCGIAHKKNEMLTNLSDGERQKATIAKALAQDTPFILLDEPTAFLDLPARVEVMHLLRNLASNTGKSILMSTHDLDLALQMADKLWLLHENKIINGSPEDLLLTNAFQPIFSNANIGFDNKTGLFKVQYQHEYSFFVKGHGFEYVLLRRACSRKGIKLEQVREDSNSWIEINNNQTEPYILKNENNMEQTYSSVEKIVEEIVRIVSFCYS